METLRPSKQSVLENLEKDTADPLVELALINITSYQQTKNLFFLNNAYVFIKEALAAKNEDSPLL